MTDIKIIKTYIKTLEEMLSWEDSDRKIEALREAIFVLSKQIPKIPKIESWSPALCPTCEEELSESIGDGYYKHHYGLNICECGQKLKWE